MGIRGSGHQGDLAEGGDPTRKLTAILSADVAGYSRKMGQDEAGTHARLKACRELMDPLITSHGGRVVGTAGDSVLADFASVIDAVRAAVETQRALAARNRDLPAERLLEFRIGINLGDVIVDGDDIFGDGVNIAARLQAIGDPGGIAISGGVYDQIKGKLGLRFEDRGAQHVKNIADPVHVYAIDLEHPSGRPALARRRILVPALAALGLLLAGIAAWIWTPLLLERTPAIQETESQPPLQPESPLPRIAVLPFENRSGDPDEAYFSDGITEDIIIEISRFSDLIVLPWSAVEPYREPEPGSIRKALGVDYLVEGSIRKAGDQVRATVQLSDARAAGVIWSERYEEPVGEIFALQDRIVRQIVDALAVRVTRAEQQRSSAKPTESLRAYDLVLRGRVLFAENTRAATFEAHSLFEQAVELDPHYGAAYAWLARIHLQLAEDGWTERPALAVTKARELLQEAIRLDPGDASAHALLGTVYLWQRRYEQALTAARRAIELNPGDFASLTQTNLILLLVGETDRALEGLERVVRFNPSPTTTQLADLALAYILKDRSADAVRMVERSMTRYPESENVISWIVATAAYARAGRDEQAAAAAGTLRRVDPFFSPENFAAMFRNPDDGRKLETALTSAGLE